MTNTELKEFLLLMKSELKAQIEAQNTMIDKLVLPKIEELITKVDKTNGRVTELVKKEIKRDSFCNYVQEGKVKSDKREKVKMVTQIIISAFAAALMLQFGILEFLKLVK